MKMSTFLIALAAVVLVYLSPEVASQQCRSGVTDEVRQSVREQLRQFQSGGGSGTFPTVAVNCGQVCIREGSLEQVHAVSQNYFELTHNLIVSIHLQLKHPVFYYDGKFS